MTSLQPLQALNLGSVQQQEFIKFVNSLPEKPPTTVRIFDRNDYYSVHGEDATTAAREVFSSTANIKKMGLEPNKMDYLVLSKGNFEILVKKLLLVKRYRVEIYVTEGSTKSCDWYVKYKGSPGCLYQMEELLELKLPGSDDATATTLIAVNIRTDPVSKCRQVGVAWVNSCDYQLSVAEFTDDELYTELETTIVQLAPSECLLPHGDTEEYKAVKKVMERANVAVTRCKKSEFTKEGIIQDLNRLLKFAENQHRDANSLPETRCEVAMSCLAAAFKYLELLSDETNFGRFRLSKVKTDSFLHLDPAALSALNVFPEPGDTGGAHTRSLYGLLDRCRSANGKRLLAQWLRQPLRDINLINERLDVVECLMRDSAVRLRLYEDHLRRIPDLQAIARRLTRNKATLHDCYRIYQVIQRLPSLLQCLAETDNSTVHACLAEPISELNDELSKYQQMIEATIDMEAVDRGDYLVKSSFDENLQSLGETLDELQSSAEKQLKKAARDLSLEAGKTIKLESNAASGFHFRVTLKEEKSLRGNSKYNIIDAVKSGVRFNTNTLRGVSDDYVRTNESYKSEQRKVVTEIVAIAAGYSECLFCLSHILSRLDVLVAFAIAALSAPTPYCRPEVVESLDEFVLEDVRHPCMELEEGISFIPNDVVFKRGECIMHIVTGANMGGKSTWMRSAGAVALLAHAGCPVPCARAKIPLLRTLAARVGASDREQLGQSTFMLEMIEAAAILRTATPDSLVLIDELGRGTSTYEGCGLARAIAEDLAERSGCFCLFATHYHELTRLPRHLPGLVVNSHAEALVTDGQLVLLHKITRGAATESLGLDIARLASLPESILEYAETKQAQMETNLFYADSSEESKDAEEGQKIIEDILQQCQAICRSTTSDEEMTEQIQTMKDALKLKNSYVQALIKDAENLHS